MIPRRYALTWSFLPLAATPLALAGCDDDGLSTATDTSPGDATDTSAPSNTLDTAAPNDTAAPSDLVDAAEMTDAAGPGFKCVCDVTVAANKSRVDMSSVAPGSVVCLVAGADGASRSQLRLDGIAGSEAKPIIITSCAGVLTIESTNYNAALALNGSHFRVTGAGLDGVEHGLRFGAPGASAAALVLGRADHYEVDHVEIYSSGFAGIMAKVDPGKTSCTENDRRFDPWVMEGVHIHHNWIHNVSGEGLYLGNSFYNGADRYCNTERACDWSACDAAGYAVRLQYPHSVRAVRIHHNLVEDTGQDGLQIGSADADCVIHDNIVRRYGIERLMTRRRRPKVPIGNAQRNGIQTSAGSTCDVLRNTVISGRVGLHLCGIGDVVVANNVFVDIADDGIAPHAMRLPCGLHGQNPCDPLIRPFTPSAKDGGFKGPVRIGNNTIVMSTTIAGYPVRPYGNGHFPGEFVYNNLVVAAVGDWRGNGLGMWDVQGNVHVQTLDKASVKAPAASPPDLHLVDDSPAIDAGVDVSAWGIVDDFDGTARPQRTGWDAGAYEAP